VLDEKRQVGLECRVLADDRPPPSLDRIYQLGLWSAIFFAIFHRLPPNKFLRIPPDFSPVVIRLPRIVDAPKELVAANSAHSNTVWSMTGSSPKGQFSTYNPC
jgi:hypothetical protein